MDKKNKKIKLQEKHHKLKTELNKIRKELNIIEFYEKYDSIKQFIGKCYISTQNSTITEIIYIYGIDLNGCKLKSTRILYTNDLSKKWLDINEHDYFDDILNEPNFNSEWIEITQSQFLEHYNTVLSVLNTIVPPNIFNV